jgi:hypothetical protein
MKTIIILLITSVNLVFGREDANETLAKSVYLVTVRGGVTEVVNDVTELQMVRFEGQPSINMDTLRKAWKSCYGALIQNDKQILDSFFIKGAPRHLQVGDKLEGQLKVLTVSTQGTTVRIVLKLEVGPSNNVNGYYDAHIWRMNPKGNWEVESILYP